MTDRKSSGGIGTGSGDIGIIAECCGTEVALELCRQFGGSKVYIPKLKSLSRELRDKAIRREFFLEDATVGELARRYGLSTRRVFYIIQKEDQRGRVVERKVKTQEVA